MKKFRLICLLTAIVFLFSGCNSFRLATSIDDLISPISPIGDDAGVQNAVDEFCKSGYSSKIPTSGKYTTSFVFSDLDGDKVDEAIAFYAPSDLSGMVCMAVINKNDDKWSVIDNVQQAATDVNSVDFCDLTGDGNLEIIVCWSVVSKTSGSNICVYSRNTDEDGYKLRQAEKPVSAGSFVCLDMNDDGSKELLVFSNISSSESPYASLYSFESGIKRLLGTTKLDRNITSFESINCSKTDDGMTVYADAVKSGGSSMVTELIYWSDYYNSIISPFYSYSSGKTSQTTRSNSILSRDINSDSFIEIPIDEKQSKMPAELSAQNWVAYENTVLKHKCYSVSSKRDGIILVIPDKLFKSLSYEYDSNSRKITAYSNKNNEQIFELMTVIKSSYSSDDKKYSDYTNVFGNSGFVYLAKINADAENTSIDIETLANMIKPY